MEYTIKIINDSNPKETMLVTIAATSVKEAHQKIVAVANDLGYETYTVEHRDVEGGQIPLFG